MFELVDSLVEKRPKINCMSKEIQKTFKKHLNLCKWCLASLKKLLVDHQRSGGFQQVKPF